MRFKRPIKRFCLLAMSCLVVGFAPAWASATASTPVVSKQTPIEEIKPPNVLNHVARLRAELELLRYTMGKPMDTQDEIIVRNANPREVFYQALTLFQKANRLSFEQTRTRSYKPVTPDGKILPGHVYLVVDSALQLIRGVKAQLAIDEVIEQPQYDPQKQPADVFQSILQANRQLNLLLELRFEPKDVYQRVSFAISYTARLLELFPNISRMPGAESLQQGIFPRDVFQRLLNTFKQVRKIGDRSGLAMLELDTLSLKTEEVVPSDVYDIASLVVSELAFLHSQISNAAPPRKVYDPGRKFPAQVYQRVGILESQLRQLDALIQQYPNWLHDY